jgi:hypothetical protein
MEEIIMRKRLAFVLPALLFVGALISPASFAGNMSEFDASEMYDPFDIFGGGPVGELVFPPTVTCPGHEPTSNPLQPCPDDSRTHSRNGMWISRVEAADPNMVGMMTVVINSNANANFEGPAWGTFTIALDSGGTWEGRWQGVRVAEDGFWTATLHIQGQGYGGAVDGKKMIAQEQITSFGELNLAYYGFIEGRIISPK